MDEHTRPLVIDFVAGIDTHLDTVGFSTGRRRELRGVLINEET